MTLQKDIMYKTKKGIFGYTVLIAYKNLLKLK